MSDKISYYFRDTDVLKDNDIRAGMRKFGGPIVIALLDAIYEQAFGRNGYYLQWISEDNETASSLAEDVYLYSEEDIQRVVDIVHFFVKRGIFDECMFQSQSVLTSKRMQETFKRYRSKFKMDCTVDPRYDLTAKNTVSEQPAGNPPETRRHII